uniref:B-cell maturation antigen-like 2 n=1 Tax=Petromyzon marinus TaxID=7757 RepID=A0A5Q0MV08_PETMA|nr:B-cell maturation antigen-like 2 [Petromyzon marinus]
MTSHCPAHFYFDKLLRTCQHCLLMCHKTRPPAECRDTCRDHASHAQHEADDSDDVASPTRYLTSRSARTNGATPATVVAESTSKIQASDLEHMLYIVLAISISLTIFVVLIFLIYRRIRRRESLSQPPLGVEMRCMKSAVVHFNPTSKSTFGAGYSQVTTTTEPVSETGHPDTSQMVTNYT